MPIETDELIELTGIKNIAEEIEKIFFVLYGDIKCDHISINLVDKINVLNKEAWGTIELEGVTYGFHIRDGDWNGSELLEFRKEPINIPKTKTKKVFVPLPRDRKTFQSDSDYELYLKKFEAKKPELDEIARKFNYDSYFSLTGSVQNHYSDIASQMGFIWGLKSIEVPLKD